MKVNVLSETHVEIQVGRFKIVLGQTQGSNEPDGINISVPGLGDIAMIDFYHAVSGQPCGYSINDQNPRVMVVVDDPFVGDNLGYIHYYEDHTIMYLESGIEIHSADTLQKPMKWHTGQTQMHYLHFERD